MYARISDDRTGEGLGVARQVRDCHKLAEERGWVVVGEYVDNDLSAYRGKRRPRYEAMMDDLRAGGFDAIVAYHQDRLTRTPPEFEAFLTACEHAGMTHFATVTGYADLQHGDSVMVARIFAAVAANESDAKSRRVRRKNDERAERGLPHLSGQRPFGYDRDGTTVREDEAVVIRTLAVRFLAGESLTSLTAWLQESGIKTATGMCDWRTPTLRNLLKSPRIAGLREHRGEVVGRGVWPAIISLSQHRQITARLNDPTRKTIRTPRRYALSGLVRCGLCGAKMVSAPDSGRRRYGCRSGPDFGGCGKVYVAANALDELIARGVLLRLDGPEMAAALSARHADDDEHQTLSAALQADDAQLEELATAYADQLITMAEWRVAARRIGTRRASTEKALARLAQHDVLDGLVGNGSALRNEWATLNLTRQAAIIAAVVDRVVIQPAARASNRLDIHRVQPVWRV